MDVIIVRIRRIVSHATMVTFTVITYVSNNAPPLYLIIMELLALVDVLMELS